MGLLLFLTKGIARLLINCESQLFNAIYSITDIISWKENSRLIKNNNIHNYEVTLSLIAIELSIVSILAKKWL